MPHSIFISHSARSTDDVAYRDVIVTGLRARRYDVFLDKESLQAGDDWNRMLINGLGYCRGAVLLMGADALKSEFVKLEAANLFARWIREGDATFRFCPVLLPSVELADVQTGFYGAIKFDRNQFIVHKSAPEALALILGSFGKLPDNLPRTPLERLERAVAAALLRGTAPELLQLLVEEAGAADAESEVAEEERTQQAPQDAAGCAAWLAARLLRSSLRDATLMLNELRIDRQASLDIFELIAPSWVSLEAGHALAPLLQARPQRRVAVVNGDLVEFTPDMYACRACAQARGRAAQVVSFAPSLGVADEQALLAQVRQRLWTKYARPGRGSCPVDDAELKQSLAARVLPVVVAMRMERSDLGLLSALEGSDLLSNVRFLALCGPTPPDGEDERVLYPLLAPQQEAFAQEIYDDGRRMFAASSV